MNTRTGGEIAATDENPAAVQADGYVTRDIHPASRTERKPDGQTAADREKDGYDHREIAPRDRRDVPPPPPPPRSCRTVMLSFREADFAARPPCYR